VADGDARRVTCAWPLVGPESPSIRPVMSS
jgi:hypothetical protein